MKNNNGSNPKWFRKLFAKQLGGWNFHTLTGSSPVASASGIIILFFRDWINMNDKYRIPKTIRTVPWSAWTMIDDIDDIDDCIHKSCTSCHGSGRKEDGTSCIHGISCPCKKCSPSIL